MALIVRIQETRLAADVTVSSPAIERKDCNNRSIQIGISHSVTDEA